MKKNSALKLIMALGMISFTSSAMAEHEAEILALKNDVKRLADNLKSIDTMLQNQRSQNTVINELKAKLNTMDSSFNSQSANLTNLNLISKNLEIKSKELEKKSVIGNTSCYNLRKNPKVKVYKIGDSININAGDYLLCGVLNTKVAFFNGEGNNVFDFILSADLGNSKYDLLRFTKAGNTFTQEFKNLYSMQNAKLNYRVILPKTNQSSSSTSSSYSSTSYSSYSPSYSSTSSSSYSSTSSSSSGNEVTLYVLSINDI